jgi:C4-dicarboxylate-specific signal transduction histidine kinase
MMACVLAVPTLARAAANNVLVIYSHNRFLPANIEVDRGLNGPVESAPSSEGLRFFTEFLDHPDFVGAEYERRAARYMRDKYASHKPRVILAGGVIALGFVLRYRDEMFPGVPIAYMGVDSRRLPELSSDPEDLKGIHFQYDIAGTLALAVELHPRARRLVVVSGADAESELHRRDVVEVLAKSRLKVEVEHWTNLPMRELLERLAALPLDTIVYTKAFHRDGAGGAFFPRDAMMLMASASKAPIYSPVSTHIGAGAVGGRAVRFVDVGRETRRLLQHMISGSEPRTAHEAQHELKTVPDLDWRQLERWGVDFDLVPSDAIFRFRPQTFMELYRAHAVAGGLVFLAQALLISALLVERRRRQRTARALIESQHHLSAATKAARLSTFNWNLCVPRPDSAVQPRRHSGWHGDVIQHVEDFADRVHPSDRERLAAAIEGAIDRQEELDIELRLVEKAGGAAWIEVRGQVSDGCHITGVAMDITERKEAEAQSAQDRAMMMHLSRISTVGQLSVGIAHQLNQPLAAIRFNTDTARKILKRLELGVGELKEILDDINEENKRAADIIRNVSALYRRAPVEAASFDINELVLETVQLLREEAIWRHVRVRVEPEDDLPLVRGSRVQIQQVLLNLMLNGMQAMSETPVEDRVLTLRTAKDDKWVTVSVADRGKGIAQEELEHIFDPFWTTKANGIGVGLPISRSILEAHHGTIAAASPSEGGAAFTISLPISGPA